MKGFFRLRKGTEGGRLGEIVTPHGVISTPVFMPVGSLGSVKGVSPKDLESLGVQMIVANAYHLYLRPGLEIIGEFGGLHTFMGWGGPILTDSGGYQVFSLAKLREVTDEGVTFRSHLDGSLHLFTPEKAIKIQEALGADIIMSLDECLPYPVPHEVAVRSVERSTHWAKRGKEAKVREDQALFGIVQGSVYRDLRQRSVEGLLEIGFDGYAIGGLSVGEEKEVTYEMVELTCGLLPKDQPRYLMGMGAPEDIVEGVMRGVDMFDCVLPTRLARTGELFTPWGKLNIKNAQYAKDKDPIDPQCECYTCQHFSRAYLRHLFLSRELLAYWLNTIHNLHYYHRLMVQIRQAIEQEDLQGFKRRFYTQRVGEEGE